MWPEKLAATVGGVGRSMAKFFLSHSAKDGSTASALLDALVEAFRAVGHDPFEDSQIRPGERWRGRLYDELARCDGAVVLMDEAALTSWWVHREVFNLLWRQHLGSVEIRVVMLDGVRAAALRSEGFGELVDLQFRRPGDNPPEQLAADVVASFGSMPDDGRDNMRNWIEDVISQLNRAPVGHALRNFAEHVGLEPEERDGLVAPGCYRFLAHQLLGRPSPDGTYRAVDALRYEIGSDRTALLAELSAPALVEGRAAHVLLRPDPSAPRIFLLNAESTATAALYVSRAACCARTHLLASVSARTGEEGVSELQQRCEAALGRMLRMGRRSGERLYEEIARMPLGRDQQVEAGYLAIDLADGDPEPVAEVIHRLHARIPWLIIIVLSTSAATLARTQDLMNSVLLEPLLSEGEEDAMGRVIEAFREWGGRVGALHG
jgi:hypothetical protein